MTPNWPFKKISPAVMLTVFGIFWLTITLEFSGFIISIIYLCRSAYSRRFRYGSSCVSGACGCGNGHRGTIFKMQTDGSGFAMLHAFADGGSDGQQPAYSRLALSGNTLYGMTEYGGGNSDLGKGTIFKINVNGSGYTVLHTFIGGTNDGADPHGGLTVVGDTLYRTTKAGGTSDYGTLFKIGTDGSGFSIQHSFGANNGTGYGTVYSFAVPEPSTLILFGIAAISLFAWRRRRTAKSPGTSF